MVKPRFLLLIISLCCIVAFLFSGPVIATAAEEFDPKTKKPIIELFRESPDAIPLEPRDPTKNLLNFYRDCSKIEGRDPGPIDIQRTIGGTAKMGIPTFFRAPVALCPQDLVAGKVDIAIMGAPIDLSSGMRGTGFGPSALRTAPIYTAWGAVLKVAHPVVGDIDFMQEFNVVDYGDAAVDNWSAERTAVAVHHLVRQVVDAGVVPVVIGGDHSLMYADVVAVTDKYGKGKVAVVHWDAHFDGIPLLFGHYLTHGAMVRRLIDEGHVKGEHFIQIGLNSYKPGGSDLDWMRQNGVKYRFMHEIDAKGWRKVLKEVLAEVEAMKIENVFLSLDTDVLDMAYAPGMGTPEPGGMTPRELFPMLRGVAAATNVVGVEMVELNPITDTTYLSRKSAYMALREILTGMAMRKKGITDPFYVDPKLKDHGRHQTKQ